MKPTCLKQFAEETIIVPVLKINDISYSVFEAKLEHRNIIEGSFKSDIECHVLDYEEGIVSFDLHTEPNYKLTETIQAFKAVISYLYVDDMWL